jgi:cbb3-type cytochrome oxidase maturation protein
MYLPYFIAYMLSGFVLSLVVLVWALKNRQFRDQQRARYLPLAGEAEARPVDVSRTHRIQAYLLVALAGIGLLAMAATLAFSLLRAK